MTEAWRCRQSPSGAHHWVLEWVDGAMPGAREHWGTCKFCGARERQDTKRPNGIPRIVPETDELQEEEQEMTIDTPMPVIPDFPTGQAGNVAKGKYWSAHKDEIRRDMAALGREATAQKWGMSVDWLYRAFPAGRPRKARAAKPMPGTMAEVHVARGPMDATTGGNGHSPLPPWRDDWTPTVQVAWLEAATAIELARVVAGARKT